jgi:hypothetical protein
LVSPRCWAQTLGQFSTLLRETAAVRAIRYDQIESPSEEAATLPLARPVMAESMQLRRAA